MGSFSFKRLPSLKPTWLIFRADRLVYIARNTEVSLDNGRPCSSRACGDTYLHPCRVWAPRACQREVCPHGCKDVNLTNEHHVVISIRMSHSLLYGCSSSSKKDWTDHKHQIMEHKLFQRLPIKYTIKINRAISENSKSHTDLLRIICIISHLLDSVPQN